MAAAAFGSSDEYQEYDVIGVILWGQRRGPDPHPHFLDLTSGVYQVRNFAFKTSNAEIQSTKCNVFTQM